MWLRTLDADGVELFADLRGALPDDALRAAIRHAAPDGADDVIAAVFGPPRAVRSPSESR